MADERENGMRVGAAANQAATILTGAVRLLADGTLSVDQLIEVHGQLAEGFLKNMQDLQGTLSVAEAFPGTQVQQATQAPAFGQQAPAQAAPGPFDGGQASQGGFTPANVVQAPFGQQAAVQAAVQGQGQNFQAAPGVQQGGSKTDQEWMALFSNPKGFYDNRQDKKSPQGPDFKNKDTGDGLWLNGKYGPAPQWVLDRLQGGYGPVQ